MENSSTENSPKTLTRTPQVPTPTPDPKSPSQADLQAQEKVKETVGEAETDLEVRVKLGQPPYICDLLEIGDSYFHFNMREMTNLVDTYLLEQGKKKDDYKKAFEELLEKVNPPRNDVYQIMGHLSEWVKIDNKLKEALKEKERIEMADPMSLSAEELRKRIYGTK